MKFISLLIILSTNLFASDYKFYGQEYPPFNYTENGKPTGAMVEIIEAVCEVTKDKCNIEIVPLKRAISLLETGEAHGVMALNKIPERDVFANFSNNIITSSMSYMTTIDKPSIANVSELKGWTIGAVAGSTSSKVAIRDTAQAAGGANVVEDANNDTVLKKITNGRYGDKGGIIMNEDVFNYLAKKNSIANVKKLFIGKTDQFGIYFSKKSVDQPTVDKFNKAFGDLKKSGELKKILNKYSFKDE